MSGCRTQFARRLQLAIGICYLIVSLALPFQHNHAPNEELVSLVERCTIATAGIAQLPLRTELRSHDLRTSQDRCVACEWQSVNVGTALHPVRFVFVAACTPHIDHAPVQNLRSASLSFSARGPPTV